MSRTYGLSKNLTERDWWQEQQAQSSTRASRITGNSDKDNDSFEKYDKKSLYIGKHPARAKSPAGSVTLTAGSVTAQLTAAVFLPSANRQ